MEKPKHYNVDEFGSEAKAVESALDNLIEVASSGIIALNQKMREEGVNREQRRKIIRELVKAAK